MSLNVGMSIWGEFFSHENTPEGRTVPHTKVHFHANMSHIQELLTNPKVHRKRIPVHTVIAGFDAVLNLLHVGREGASGVTSDGNQIGQRIVLCQWLR